MDANEPVSVGAMMRKVVLYELLTLDGVAENPDDFILDWDEVMSDNLRRVIASQDDVILGRRTYDDWAEFWPKSESEPFSSFINGVHKYVITSTPAPIWTNTTVVEGTPGDLVASLRNQPGGDIGVHGSITLSRSLLEQELVDELRLVIAPAVIVSGRKLFDGTTPNRFEVIRNVTTPTGYLLVDLRLI